MESNRQKLETIFSAGIIKSKSSQSIEKTGAFEEMDLRVDCLPQIISKQYGQVCSSSSSTIDSQKNYMHRLEINDDGIYQSSFAFCDRNGPLLKSSVTFADKEQKYQSRKQQQNICSHHFSDHPQRKRIFYYRNLSQSKNSSLHRLITIYKNSNNAVEFASNFEQYLTSSLPSYVWIALMCLLILWGLMLIIVGTVNIPFCPSRPMIPIFLIVMGCFYILWALLRIYAFWPRSHADALSIDLTCKALEGTLIVAIVVWLFLGCIWLYGPKHTIHFELIYFLPNYCNGFAHWTAFISVTLHSMIIFFGLLCLFCLLCIGLLKENK